MEEPQETPKRSEARKRLEAFSKSRESRRRTTEPYPEAPSKAELRRKAMDDFLKKQP